jgi:hypothetical protein
MHLLFKTGCYAPDYNGNDVSTGVLFVFPDYGRKLKPPASRVVVDLTVEKGFSMPIFGLKSAV